MATAYDYIARNRWRTCLLSFLFPLCMAAQGYVVLWLYYFFKPSYYYDTVTQTYLGKYDGAWAATHAAAPTVLPWVFGAALLWMIISYYWGDRIILRSAGALRAEWDEAPELLRLIDNLCVAQGMYPPPVYIIYDNSLNCFSVGRNARHASLAVTKGMIKKLSRTELEGVIAHELSHIKHGDVGLMTVTAAGVSCFTHIAEDCFQGMVENGPACSTVVSGGSPDTAPAVTFMLCLVGWIFFTLYGYMFAPLTRLALSRRREYLADASAALMTRYPEGLISALEKIARDSRVEILDHRPTIALLCIANPLSRFNLFASLSGLLTTHPPIKKRILALRDMDSGR